MSLRIKEPKTEVPEITLEYGSIGVSVLVDGEQVAHFSNNGEFEFYGNSMSTKFEGRWKE